METTHIREAEAFLASLPRFADAGAAAYRPGLERMSELLEAMGHPHERYPSVHVAGTNGKGSTSSLVASIGTAGGLHIGLHTSPHLFHVTERMRIDGKPAPREWLARAVDNLREDIERIRPSYFELTAALSLMYFAENTVDAAVVETGMGGRLDATNILMPKLAVITDIGLDHVEHLGHSVEAIAREKAGIIKEGIPVLTGARIEAADIIREVSVSKNAAFHHVADEVRVATETVDLRGSNLVVETPVRTYRGLFVGLPGKHQIRNALAALRAAELAFDFAAADQRPIFEGMRHVRELSGLRGRLEILRDAPLVVADVAHNAEGLASALAHLREAGHRMGRLVVLLGVMRDKDVRAMADLLAAAGATVRPVSVDSPRAYSPRELAETLAVSGVDAVEPGTVEEGIRAFLSDASHADTLLITGSHLVVSQLGEAPL